MDAKYIACLMLFLSFSVLSGSEPEFAAAVRQAESPPAKTPTVVDCHPGSSTLRLAGTPSAMPAQLGASSTSNSKTATEDILQSLTCLMASL